MPHPAPLTVLAKHLLSLPCPHPLRVAIDGVDTAGKTTLADSLARSLRTGTRQVVRASIDGFHHPRAFRYRRGHDSSEGYYEDSFDLPTLRRLLLDPLGLGGDHDVYTQSFDFRSDSPNLTAVTQVAPNAILLFDGVFLQRPQLAGCFDCVLFVQVSFETVLERAVQRDAHLLGGAQAARERYLRRYIPAQQQYLRASSPAELADIIIQNDNPHNPIIIFNPNSLG